MHMNTYMHVNIHLSICRGPWKAGDVVGCLINITSSSSSAKSDSNITAKISFTLNGSYLGEAFEIDSNRYVYM